MDLPALVFIIEMPQQGGDDILLVLPGIEGIGMEAKEQFGHLSTFFDTWSLTVHHRDQSTFQQLADRVLWHI